MGYTAKQKKVKVRIEGAEKIVKELKEMEDGASSVLLSAAKEGGKIALDDAKRNCPVDTGALRDSLALKDGKATKIKATVSVDYDKSLRYGTFVELGARGREPNPFLRNAVDDNIDKINETIRDAVAKGVGR